MRLMTITKFAEKHKVSRQAIHAAIARKEIKTKQIAGLKFIDSASPYHPIRGRGRRSFKKK